MIEIPATVTASGGVLRVLFRAPCRFCHIPVLATIRGAFRPDGRRHVCYQRLATIGV